MFLKFFDIYWNRPGIWLQKFAAGVTKLFTPDEIRRYDGTKYGLIPSFKPSLIDLRNLLHKHKICS